MTLPCPRRIVLLLLLTIAVAMPGLPADSFAQDSDPNDIVAPELLQALDWRMVGPYRGGRSTAVTGHHEHPDTFWMGTTGGGVWVTDDAGHTWSNISDGFFGGSIGSIDVADTDANVIYVGTGSADTRGNTSVGRGVWRSTDGGSTWSFAGLPEAGQIGSIEIDPRDPDRVYAAALGHPFGPNEERGVYRSTDGGASWERVLYVSSRTGAMDIQINQRNPRELWASMWTAERKPWTMISGSEESGIWRSTDGGDTWIEMTDPALDNGLPTGVMGKIGLAISPANPKRVWALIEAEDPDGGVWRTDDGGASWELLNTDRNLRQRAWYYTHLMAHPQDANTLYGINTRLYRSIDGGRTFETIQVPHGDVHDLWVNPEAPSRMVVGDDGGAQVTVNDGRTWSTYYNQPTAELYDVAVDNDFPYRLYAGQQDNTGIGVPAWHDANSLHAHMGWVNPGGCETGPIAVDPNDSNITYGGCYGGAISYVNRATGEYRNILVYPQLQSGMAGRDLKYRFQWVSPILVSQHDSNVVYHASNFVHRTTDGGFSWDTVSPDLTTDDPEHQDFSGGPIHHDITGVEIYGTIFALAESPHDPQELWAGSDDGRINVSRDGGATWTDVTPAGLPQLGTVDEIDVSAHAAGRATVAVQRYRMDDLAPYIFQTDDWGASWELLTDGSNGIPADSPVRTVREDPERRGLLYAGTEFGVYVSFDDGAHWQSLQLDLPITPVTGMKVHRGDLVISTQGRSFWILDDISPLRELGAQIAGRDAHLFAPRLAWRANMGGVSEDNRTLEAPPQGATIHYALSEAAAGQRLNLEIVGAGDEIIRSFFSAADGVEHGDEPELPAEPGLNRFVWDLQYASPEVPDDVAVWGYDGGPKALPGLYTVRLWIGDSDTPLTQQLEVRLDPRLTDVTPEQLQEQLELAAHLRDRMQAIGESIEAVRSVRDQVEAGMKRAEIAGAEEPLREATAAMLAELDAIEALLYQPRAAGIQDLFNFEPQLMSEYAQVYQAVTGPDGYIAGGPDRQPTAGAKERTEDLDARWAEVAERLHALLTDGVARINEAMSTAGVPGVVVGSHE